MSTEVRTRTVLEVLGGRQTVAAAADRLGVTRQTVYNWQAAFVAAGAQRLAAETTTDDGAPGRDRSTRRVEEVVVAIVDRLRDHAGRAELDMPTLEAIRTGAGMPVNRFCALTGIARRTYYARRDAPADSAPAAPAQRRIDAALGTLQAHHPEWGARRIWRQLTEVEGIDVSLATVKRALDRRS